MWLHSLKVAQLLRSAACLHTNQSRSYLNHLVQWIVFVSSNATDVLRQQNVHSLFRWPHFPVCKKETYLLFSFLRHSNIMHVKCFFFLYIELQPKSVLKTLFYLKSSRTPIETVGVPLMVRMVKLEASPYLPTAIPAASSLPLAYVNWPIALVGSRGYLMISTVRGCVGKLAR